MNKSITGRVPQQPHQTQRSSDTALISILKARQCAKIAEFREALIASGFNSVDAQAAVLGLRRSSTWMILNRKHKASGLSASVISRIMRSKQLPPTARAKLEEYVQEKLMGNYGHPRQCLRRFRNQLLSVPAATSGQSESESAAAPQDANYGQSAQNG